MKRANGTGSIIKLGGQRRKPYVVKVSEKDKRGYILQKAIGYYRTASEAQAALDEYNEKRRRGLAPSVSMLDMTVGQVFQAWSSREYKKLNPPSITSHNASWNKRVSRFADRKMRNVTLDEWQSILDEDEENGLSQSTINNDSILIRALFSYSMERDIVGKDYSRYLDIPSVDPKKRKGSFDDLQVKRLEKMAEDGMPWADTALVLCYTGFRISEFCGLSIFSYHSDGDYLQAGGKTEAGRDRIVPVHPKIKPYIVKWISAADQYLVTNNQSPITAAWYRVNVFPEIANALGEPDATPHWCRHTFATRLHAAGVDELTRKWLMGHSTKGDVTNRYTHQSVSVLTDAIRLLA